MCYCLLQVVIILSILQVINCKNNESFCVKFDDPIAFLPMPVHSNIVTEYYPRIKINKLIKRVKVPFPLSTSMEVPLGPILDFRFYNLTYYQHLNLTILNNITAGIKFYFSIRAVNLDNITNNETDFKWHHIELIRINETNDFSYEDLKTGYQSFTKNLIFNNNFFFHNYTFAYFVDPISVRKPLYKSSESKFCIHFFLKMCNECTLTVVCSTYEQLYTTRNKSAWNFEHFCVHNNHMNDTVEIQTNFPGEHAFWALGEELYILSDRHFRQYVQLSPSNNLNFEQYCYDVNNTNVTVTKDWTQYFIQSTEKADEKTIATLNSYSYTLGIIVTALFIVVLIAGAIFYKSTKRRTISNEIEIEVLQRYFPLTKTPTKWTYL